MKKRTHRGSPERGGAPTPLSETLGSLFAARGYARTRAVTELQDAWERAVGPDLVARTRLGTVRHGVLSVTVAHPTLLEELAAFRKPAILAALRKEAPGTPVLDLRFRVGPIED